MMQPGVYALILTVLMGLIGCYDGKEVQHEFKIVPNKPDNVEVALDTPPIESSTCKFEWESTGATVEVWISKPRLFNEKLRLATD